MGRRSVVGEHFKVVYLVTFSLHGRGLFDLLNNNSARTFSFIFIHKVYQEGISHGDEVSHI